MVNRYQTKGIILSVFVVLVMLGALGFIVYVVRVYSLQTNYRQFRNELSYEIGENTDGTATVSMGGKSAYADAGEMYYYINLTTFSGNIMAISRRRVSPTDESITVTMKESVLIVSPDRDGTAINLHWEKGKKTYDFTIGGTVNYSYVARHFESYLYEYKAKYGLNAF